MIDRLVMDALSAVAIVGVLLLVRGARGVPCYAAPCCRRCGYDVRRTTERPDTCPECGASFDGAHAIRFARRRRARGLMAIGVLGIVVAAGVVITTRLEQALAPPAPAAIAAPPGTPGTLPPLDLDGLSIDERIAAMNREPIDVRIWEAVKTDLTNAEWTAAHSTDLIDALAQYVEDDAIRRAAQQSRMRSQPFGLATSMIEPMLKALATAGRLDDPAVARASFDRLLGPEPVFTLETDDRRLGRVHGTVGFKDSDAVPVCALLHAHDVRVNGTPPPARERWLRLPTGINRLAVNRVGFEPLTESIDLEIDLEYAFVPRSTLPTGGARAVGPPSTWNVPPSERVRTTLRTTIAPPDQPDTIAVRGVDADAAVRAATRFEPLHVFRDRDTLKAFCSFSITASDCAFELQPVIEIRIGDDVHPINGYGRRSSSSSNGPTLTVLSGQTLLTLPAAPDPDVTHATVVLRTSVDQPNQFRFGRPTGPYWVGELEIDIPIERADLHPD